MHGSSTQSFATKPPQVLGADTGVTREFIERPVATHVIRDALPEPLEPVIELPWLGKVLHVAVNELDPVKHGGRLRLAFVLGDESFNGMPEGCSIEGGHHGRAAGEDCALLGLLFVTDPAAFPFVIRHGPKSIGHEGGQGHGGSGPAFLPPAIDEYPALALQAGQEVGAALVDAHDFVGGLRYHDARVADAVGGEGVANGCPPDPGSLVGLVGAHDPVLGVFSQDVGFG